MANTYQPTAGPLGEETRRRLAELVEKQGPTAVRVRCGLSYNSFWHALAGGRVHKGTRACVDRFLEEEQSAQSRAV